MVDLAIGDPTRKVSLNGLTGQPRRQVHVNFTFDAYVIGNPNMRRAIYDNVIQTWDLFRGRVTNLNVTTIDRNPNTKPGRVKLISVSVDFDTWTVIDPHQFGKIGTQFYRENGSYWISTNMGTGIKGRLSMIRAIRNKRNFKIKTSGEWEDAHLAN